MARLALFFTYVWPEPRSSAAGVRTRELIDFLRESGWSVAAASPSGDGPYREELKNLGVETLSCDPNSPLADEILGHLRPNLVIYDRFVMEEQFGWRVRQLWPGVREIVDTQDLHSLRRARERLAEGNAPLEQILRPSLETFGEDLLRELASLQRAGAALVVSEFEARLLVELEFPENRLLCLPFSSEPEVGAPAFADRRGFCFLGNFRHPPNLDSVRWTLREVWPRVRELLPGAELHLYGAYPPAEVSAHKGQHGVFAHGPVADHRAALRRHRVLLSPLRFGAGIKGKVLESWGTGTPVAGTTLTFEGMGPGCVAEGTEAIAALATRLHEEEAFWTEARDRSFTTLRERFAREALKTKFLRFLEAVPHGPSLTGAMLRHHSANSSKYFSRWIEAKNRRS